MTKRYVSGKKNGALQGIRGYAARDILRDRNQSPGWFAQHYPIIYELVPVPAGKLKPKKRAAAEERKSP